MAGFVVTFEGGSVKSVEKENNQQNVYCGFDAFCIDLRNAICNMHLKHTDTDKIFDLFGNLVEHITILLVDRIKKTEGANDDIIDTVSRNLEFVKSKFDGSRSRSRRQKEVSSNPCYVAPQPKAIGLKWKTKASASCILPAHQMVQKTMQYVPILETLKAIFSVQKFRDAYFEHNATHTCEPGIFTDFCCGSTFKNTEVFTNDRSSIQIQLSTDDFEICCGLKSKASIHTLCGVYFRIRNVPEAFRSELCYYNLVCLCNTSYVKEAGGFDVINELIVNELKVLESKGIEIGPNIVLKGALVDISADNKGANGVFGFTESFSASYYCRQCELPKEECAVCVREDSTRLRTKSSYNNCLKLTHNMSKLDLKKTLGVKRGCLFNELRSFDMFENWSFDLMHDCNEGSIKFLLQELFVFWTQKRMLTLEQIQCMIRDFNYGVLSSKNRPSLIKLDKKNLGQNASQLYCIMIHMPFIFFNVKEKLGVTWRLCDKQMKIMQIMYANKITERNVLDLEKLIEDYLSDLKSILGKPLLPKHHFHVHYPTFIRKMGPPIHSWMMRYEAKHKQFTDMAKVTHNFKDISKTLSEKHQQNNLASNLSFEQCLKPSKTKKMFVPVSTEIQNIIRTYFGKRSDELTEYKFLNGPGTVIKKGLFVFDANAPFEIDTILFDGENYSIIGNKYAILRYDQYFNSIEIEKTGFTSLVQIDILTKTYEKIACNQSLYIIIENLNIIDL